jgi:hypothetical protein
MKQLLFLILVIVLAAKYHLNIYFLNHTHRVIVRFFRFGFIDNIPTAEIVDYRFDFSINVFAVDVFSLLENSGQSDDNKKEIQSSRTIKMNFVLRMSRSMTR